MGDPERDRTLAAGFRDGDPDALSAVVDRYSPEIFRFLKFCTRQQDLAEDLTQEVFVRAYSKRHLLVRYTNFRAWLYTIARNIAAKEMKKHHYRLELRMEEMPPAAVAGISDPAPGAVTTFHEDQIRGLLVEAVNQLDHEARELIVMRYFSELPLKEIAEALNIPMGSIGGKLSRALLTVRRYLESKGISWDDVSPMD